MNKRVQSLISLGNEGLVIDIECHLSNSLPNIVIVGFANKAVDESKERIRGAFGSSNIQLPRKRITINLAPADVPKDSSSLDLAIATAILVSSAQVKTALDTTQALIGELGLDGTVRPVRGIIGKLLVGRKHGIQKFFIPADNLDQALMVPGITLIPLSNFSQLYLHLNETELVPVIETGEGKSPERKESAAHYASHTISDVVGQAQAKRALEIAAAGGHNVLLNGPPGTGKSMLAKALPSLLPPLTHEEMLEVTHIHSLIDKDYDHIVTERPFRAPHHSASHVAVVGGGTALKPGEISLSHRGILFFDELPEFHRSTLEALRQPLEDRKIVISRAKDSADYPANFLLVATANPCPCGHYGTTKSCSCQPYQVLQYQRKLSGPLLDRIDLYVAVDDVDHEKLLSQKRDENVDTAFKKRISLARNTQAKRYQNAARLNSDMNNGDIVELANVSPDAKTILDTAAQKLNISARSYMRTIKVARTIADLGESHSIEAPHITEALQFRSRTTFS